MYRVFSSKNYFSFLVRSGLFRLGNHRCILSSLFGYWNLSGLYVPSILVSYTKKNGLSNEDKKGVSVDRREISLQVFHSCIFCFLLSLLFCSCCCLPWMTKRFIEIELGYSTLNLLPLFLVFVYLRLYCVDTLRNKTAYTIRKGEPFIFFENCNVPNHLMSAGLVRNNVPLDWNQKWNPPTFFLISF